MQLKRLAFRARYPWVEVIDPDERHLESLRKRGFMSQFGQDEYVWARFFEQRTTPGFFVDVGGNDPVTLNNTFYFEKIRGWQGLCVEPLARFHDAWKAQRAAALAPYAATDCACELDFEEVELDDWGHAFSAVAGSSSKLPDLPRKRTRVKGRRLADIFSEHGISHVDFMSLDVEGHETQALAGIDFDRTVIDVIAVENNAPTYAMGSGSIRRYLRRRGYRYVARFWLLDDIFVRREFIDALTP